MKRSIWQRHFPCAPMNSSEFNSVEYSVPPAESYDGGGVRFGVTRPLGEESGVSTAMWRRRACHAPLTSVLCPPQFAVVT